MTKKKYEKTEKGTNKKPSKSHTTTISSTIQYKKIIDYLNLYQNLYMLWIKHTKSVD